MVTVNFPAELCKKLIVSELRIEKKFVGFIKLQPPINKDSITRSSHNFDDLFLFNQVCALQVLVRMMENVQIRYSLTSVCVVLDSPETTAKPTSMNAHQVLAKMMAFVQKHLILTLGKLRVKMVELASRALVPSNVNVHQATLRSSVKAAPLFAHRILV